MRGGGQMVQLQAGYNEKHASSRASRRERDLQSMHQRHLLHQPLFSDYHSCLTKRSGGSLTCNSSTKGRRCGTQLLAVARPPPSLERLKIIQKSGNKVTSCYQRHGLLCPGGSFQKVQQLRVVAVQPQLAPVAVYKKLPRLTSPSIHFHTPNFCLFRLDQFIKNVHVPCPLLLQGRPRRAAPRPEVPGKRQTGIALCLLLLTHQPRPGRRARPNELLFNHSYAGRLLRLPALTL